MPVSRAFGCLLRRDNACGSWQCGDVAFVFQVDACAVQSECLLHQPGHAVGGRCKGLPLWSHVGNAVELGIMATHFGVQRQVNAHAVRRAQAGALTDQPSNRSNGGEGVQVAPMASVCPVALFATSVICKACRDVLLSLRTRSGRSRYSWRDRAWLCARNERQPSASKLTVNASTSNGV